MLLGKMNVNTYFILVVAYHLIISIILFFIQIATPRCRSALTSILFDGRSTELVACIKGLKAVLVSATSTIEKHNTRAMRFAEVPPFVTLATGAGIFI